MASVSPLLLITVLATASALVPAMAGTSASALPPARRSRFLLVGGTIHPPLPAYDCSKKSAEACLATGTACCSGQCVDTVASVQHCGGCNKACKLGRTCCGGRCVDLLSDKKNCGTCSNKCNKKCSYGFCDYAQ
uniref:Stigma-specific STIG1-like protein 1 n=1 Tax=Aegilops tauschii subsp. strangulata TaxID=200361 RepID=A0A453PTX6_AEGTS